MIFCQNEGLVTEGETCYLGRRREGGKEGGVSGCQLCRESALKLAHALRDRAQERSSVRGDLDNWPSVKLNQC